MSFFFVWLKNKIWTRGAMSFYKRGMRKARKQDHMGAIDDYTAAINMPKAAPAVKAMAQYNRALAHLAAKDIPKAVKDLSLILAMKATLTNIKSMARQKLIRLEGSTTSRVAKH